MYSVEINHKNEIDDIWKDSKYQALPFINRGYRCIRTIAPKSILFIGINPSYKENDSSTDSFYDVVKPEDEKLQYFKKFHELSVGTGLSVSHLDLLFHRERKQEEIFTILGQTHGVDFIWDQLKISKEVMEKSFPKIIVVSNTLARRFLGFEKQHNQNVWLGYDFQFDEKLGTHIIISPDSSLKGTPVFFSSMLSGQRALDNGSFERLKWHIKQVSSILS